MGKIVMRFGEVVLRTSQYEALKSWYSRVLDTKPMFESERREDLGPGAMRQMCAIRPYSEFPFTETLLIFDFAELRQCDQTVSGMDHFQMQFGSIDNLFDRYEALAAHCIVPTRSANHGPATSFYYRDPDGNRVELSVKNYATEAETLAFMQSESFRRNPAGIDVDPAEYVARYRGGVSLEELRRIPEPA
ncbi:MAG TPA: VOC family protein [Stellaceae bacterium]|nr:VOC family protein [Stellaceae bacterium]